MYIFLKSTVSLHRSLSVVRLDHISRAHILVVRHNNKDMKLQIQAECSSDLVRACYNCTNERGQRLQKDYYQQKKPPEMHTKVSISLPLDICIRTQ